jgi:hypothetical protein
MTILKTAGISLGILAIVGGGSLAVISTSAQGRMFDSTATQFLTSGDLAGYKNYLIGQETTRINAIDQTQFAKIQANAKAMQPLTDLQAKYEPQLATAITNKDQATFVSLFKQYQGEAKPLMDAMHTAMQANRLANANDTGYHKNTGTNNTPRAAPTDAQLTDMANKAYSKGLADVTAGKAFKLHAGFGGRGGMYGGTSGNKGSMHYEADEALKNTSSVTSSSVAS